MFYLLFFSIQSYAQVWIEKNQFEGGGRFGVSYFTLEEDAYLLGGIKQSGDNYIAYNELWKYDRIADTWIELENYPGGNIYGAFTFVIDDTVYIGLGADQTGTYSNQAWSYNSTTGWQAITSFSGSSRVYPFSFSSNGKGYVGSGSGSNLYMDLWEYNPTLDSWIAKNDYPGGARVGQVAFSINGKGYVGLGDDGVNFLNDFYEYNPETDEWISKSSFTGENRSFSACTVANGNGYILGGESVLGNFTNQMWFYNPNSNSWEQSSDFTDVSRRYGALFSLGGTFYYGIGQYGYNDSQVKTDFWEYDSTVNIDEIDHLSFNVYPNPISDQLNISINLPSSESFNVVIYNGHMQKVHSGTELNINTENWSNGLYHIQIETNKGILSTRIIKV